jgi:hypothetical protein
MLMREMFVGGDVFASEMKTSIIFDLEKTTSTKRSTGKDVWDEKREIHEGCHVRVSYGGGCRNPLSLKVILILTCFVNTLLVRKITSSYLAVFTGPSKGIILRPSCLATISTLSAAFKELEGIAPSRTWVLMALQYDSPATLSSIASQSRRTMFSHEVVDESSFDLSTPEDRLVSPLSLTVIHHGSAMGVTTLKGWMILEVLRLRLPSVAKRHNISMSMQPSDIQANVLTEICMNRRRRERANNSKSPFDMVVEVEGTKLPEITLQYHFRRVSDRCRSN